VPTPPDVPGRGTLPGWRSASEALGASQERGALATRPDDGLVVEEQTWELVSSPQGEYWHCPQTDETTAVGEEEPLAWHEVECDETGGSYYWCEETGETTAVGEPRPRHEMVSSEGASGNGGGLGLGQMVAMGAGMSIAFGAVRAILG
jgi:hypothetical protein